MTRRISDLRELSAILRRIGADWKAIMGDSLTGAILMGGFTEAVIDRTPQSLYTRYKDRADGMRYGQQRLLKSILPSGRGISSNEFERLYGSSSVGVILGSDLDYAVYVHEARKPREGDYYTVGSKGGWSKPSSGNKFLDRPWDENEDATFRALEGNIAASLRRLGLEV